MQGFIFSHTWSKEVLVTLTIAVAFLIGGPAGVVLHNVAGDIPYTLVVFSLSVAVPLWVILCRDSKGMIGLLFSWVGAVAFVSYLGYGWFSGGGIRIPSVFLAMIFVAGAVAVLISMIKKEREGDSGMDVFGHPFL